MATVTKEAPASANASGFENAKFDLRSVPVKSIHLGKYSLRDVDRNGEDYQRLRDAIAGTNGPLLPILVREIQSPEGGKGEAFGLIDGLQRYSCCVDLGFSTIPARVIEMDDAEIAAAQIIANRSRIETKPVEYTKQLHRMLNANPTMTLEELSDMLHCSVKWLRDRLSLANLHEKIGPLVDEGRIAIANAYALAKLKPAEEQLQFVEQAQTEGIQEFSGHVQQKIKALRDAARAGRDPSTADAFVPVPHMRTVKEIKIQFEAPTLAPEICGKVGAKTPEEGFKAALTWVLSMDPDTVEVLRQRDADRKRSAAADRKKKEEEKLRVRAVEARAAAEKAGIDLTKAPAPEEDEEDEDEA